MSNRDFQNRQALPFVANSKIVFDLPLGAKILRGKIILTGTVVVSGGTTNGTVVGEGGPIGLIQRIIIRATQGAASRYPGGRIVDATPRGLLRRAVMERGKFIGEINGSTLGNGAAGTYDIYLSIPIYWADSTLRNQVATALNTDGPNSTPGGTYRSVQVEVDTGDLTTCFAGNDRALNITGLQVQWVDDRLAIPGDTYVLYQEDHEVLIPATFKRMLDEAMPLDGNFLDWLILQETSAAATLTDDLLNQVTIQGPTIQQQLYSTDIQQEMFDDDWVDAAQNVAGMNFIDFTDGSLANSVPAGSIQTQFDVNNVSGANLDDLLIFTRRFVSPLPAQK